MANKNFIVKNGLEVGGQEVVSSSGVVTSAALGGQTLASTDSPTFNNLTLTNDIAVGGDINLTGDLNITGDVNTLSVTDLDVIDQTITLGKGQVESASGGSGIVIDGSSASILWDETNDVFDINKGIDVTGTATMDGLVVQTGSGTLTTSAFGGSSVEVASSGAYKHSSDISSGYHLFEVNSLPVAKFNNGGDISFYEDTGTTAKLFWDASTERLGIGTTSPSAKLHSFVGASAVTGIYANNANDAASTGVLIHADSLRGDTSAYTLFKASNSVGTKMIVQGDGNVGIGTSTPQGNLSVTGSSAAVGDQGIFQVTDGTGANTDTKIVMGIVASDYGWIQAVKPGTDVKDLVLQPSGGSVGIGTDTPDTILEIRNPTLATDTVNTLLTQRWSRAQTGAVKWGNSLDLLLGSYESGTINSRSRVDFRLANGTTDDPDTTVMTLQGNGNVGIGTTSPTVNLDVYNGSGWGGLDIDGTSGGEIRLQKAGTRYGGIYANDSTGFVLEAVAGTDTMLFYTNSAARMRIDSSGRVGINRAPSISNSKLEVGGADGVRLVALEASGHTGGIGIQGGTGSNKGFLLFSGSQMKIQLSDQTNVSYTADGLFNANARPSRFNTGGSGQMLLGYQDNGSGLYSGAIGLAYDALDGAGNVSYVGGFMMKDTHSGTIHLRIDTNGDIHNTNNVYTSISDSRIKSDIIDASSQWEDIKALRVRKYKLAHQPAPYNDQLQIGVIAQELESAGMNGLVDEIDPDDAQLNYAPELVGEKVKIVKYSILYMKAIKALQEAMTRIETLEARVTELES